ncbi:MAG: four helix bundle protein [Candidatus Scalindua sp.]|nr:four helix bundle protein [Candidatus Scalindua sp.]
MTKKKIISHGATKERRKNRCVGDGGLLFESGVKSGRVVSHNESGEEESMKIKRFEDIVGWQKARELVKAIYNVTIQSKGFDKDYGLKDQIRRAAVSSMSPVK